jgi:hypothetical protein
MLLELILLQSRKPAPEPSLSFSMGAMVGGAIALFLMLAMCAGGVYVIVKWRKSGGGRFAFGVPLMILPFIGGIVFGLASAAKVKLPDSAILVVPLGWLAWIVLMVVAQRGLKRQRAELEEEQIAAHKAEMANWGNVKESPLLPDFVDEGPQDIAPAAANDSAGPRRAVRLPAHESDGTGRASEETIKRMTAAQIEADAKLKGPRADEVPGNPILPDGEVKIRCLGCDKKMKADASKFRKQRRCPACKAEPFRYVTAI